MSYSQLVPLCLGYAYHINDFIPSEHHFEPFVLGLDKAIVYFLRIDVTHPVAFIVFIKSIRNMLWGLFKIQLWEKSIDDGLNCQVH